MLVIQFDSEIKIFHSNNRTKFAKGPILPFLRYEGIIHQTSCVGMPQLNGVVKTKKLTYFGDYKIFHGSNECAGEILVRRSCNICVLHK